MRFKKIKIYFLLILSLAGTIAYADDLPPTDDPPISDDNPPTDDPPIAAAPISNSIDFLFIAGLIFAGKLYFDRNQKQFYNYNNTKKEKNNNLIIKK